MMIVLSFLNFFQTPAAEKAIVETGLRRSGAATRWHDFARVAAVRMAFRRI